MLIAVSTEYVGSSEAEVTRTDDAACAGAALASASEHDLHVICGGPGSFAAFFS
jgi:hypothetical protein